MSFVLPKPQKFISRLASKIQLTKTVYLERFILEEPKEMTFFAGQTVMLILSSSVHRSMSIASVPSEKNSILLLHDVAPMGPYSKWAVDAKPGDPMELMGPLGMFIVDKQSPRKKIFVATGSGIAPFYAMISDDITRGETMLYWGVRHEEDLFWQKQFEILSRQHPNFHYTITLSQGSPAWQGKRGHVQDHIFNEKKDLLNADFYLCGNKTMVDSMRDTLAAKGVPVPQIRFELFY